MKNEVKHLKYSFGKVHGFRQCLGAVDVAHRNIKTPKNNSTDFIKKKRSSLNKCTGMSQLQLLLFRRDCKMAWKRS